MEKLKMFSLCLHSSYYDEIKDLNYIPVGLGTNEFSNLWLKDNTKDNISKKNPFYGEYTFHYWLWKNMIDDIPEKTWIGFCGYRYFWKQKNIINNESKKNDILRTIPNEWQSYESVIANKISVKNLKFLKIIKNGGISFIFDSNTYKKEKHSIKFHFDVFHGRNYIDKAVELLDDENRNDFRNYVKENNEFHKWNMFICNSKEKIKRYYDSIFPWLNRCENVFGFNLYGYGKRRIYAFLAERYLSYWFTKNTNYITWPVFRHDLHV